MLSPHTFLTWSRIMVNLKFASITRGGDKMDREEVLDISLTEQELKELIGDLPQILHKLTCETESAAE